MYTRLDLNSRWSFWPCLMNTGIKGTTTIPSHLQTVFLRFIFIVFACVFLCVCHGCVGTHRGSRKASDLLDMELHVTVSHLVCVLGPEPTSSGRVLQALSHRAISPAPKLL